MKFFRFVIVVFLTQVSCVEPYEFEIDDTAEGIVIEAIISDKSFLDTNDYPSDGKYFEVLVSETSMVTNVRSIPVENAVVVLEEENGTLWYYDQETAGRYVLRHDTFNAQPSVNYRIKVTTPTDEFVSSWEQLPQASVSTMSPISFYETTKPSETGFIDGVRATISIPTHAETHYYRWSYQPTWKFIATLASEVTGNRHCWITSKYYFIDYDLVADDRGGFIKDLFFFKTRENEVILDLLSVLVTQQTMSKDLFQFYEEMKKLNERNGLFDNPPFNLKSNFTSTNPNKLVMGYFGVVKEQAVRWNFTKDDLSYFIPNDMYEHCSSCMGPGCPPPPCVDCMRYELGTPTTEKPIWWPN